MTFSLSTGGPGPPQAIEDAMAVLQQHAPSSWTFSLVMEQLAIVKPLISVWMEQAHLELFHMEQQIKDGVGVHVDVLQGHMDRMAMVLAQLLQVKEQMEARTGANDDDEQARMALRVTITKIQSEWAGVHHFMLSVAKQAAAIHDRQLLLMDMQDILWDMDQLTSMIFQYQERRHAHLLTLVVTSKSSKSSTSDASLSLQSSPASSPQLAAMNSTGAATATTTPASVMDERLLMDLEERVDPVFRKVEQVYNRMTSEPPSDDSGQLARKHRLVQEHWECLRIEIDDLKDEIKEDRWLVVFRQVADQVDSMIDGLDKTVQQGVHSVQLILEWHDQNNAAANKHPSHPNHAIAPHSPSLSDKLKSFSRYLTHPHHHQQYQQQQSHHHHPPLQQPQPPPLDPDKFKALERNMEAKYKYYTPSIDRMLAMLGNGIATRVTKDTTAPGERHEAMITRWHMLKKAMDDLRVDMGHVQRVLMDTTPISPASSVQSDKASSSSGGGGGGGGGSGGISGRWKSLRRRPSDQQPSSPSDHPSSNHDRRVRSVTPSQQQQQQHQPSHRSRIPASGNTTNRHHHHTSRTTSPLSFQRTTSPLPQLHRSTTLIASTSESSEDVPSNSGRKSATPRRRPVWQASYKSTSTEMSFEPLWKSESRAAGHQGNQGASLSAPAAHHQHHPSRRSATPLTSTHSSTNKDVASFMKPTKSTILRARSPSVESQETLPTTNTGHSRKGSLPSVKSKKATKTPPLSSSSLQYHLPPRPKSSLASSSAHRHHHQFQHPQDNNANSTTLLVAPRAYHNQQQPRSASSLGSRSPPPMPPTRRSATPSLIPRPKTPNQQAASAALHGRPMSPSMIPRPRSRQTHGNQHHLGHHADTIPPVPPLPSHLEPPSARLFKVGIDHWVDGASSSSFVPFDTHSADDAPAPASLLAASLSTSSSSSRPRTASVAPPSSSSSFARLVKKKQSMPNLSRQRRVQPPVQSFSDDEEDDGNDAAHNEYFASSVPSPRIKIDFQQHAAYTGDPKDPLDMQVAMILNASPITIPCQRAKQGAGKYYFGNDLNPTGAGKKLYTCKLMTYTNRSRRRLSTSRNKVLVRVGGGWQDLEMFLLEHASLMTSDVIVRSFVKHE
ncbi:hypothetical protein BC940DRAFT_8762 [Gongronella butleri]|nr:hypothetical protein BC940DRAFT_8762 [Gongronella butleri]